MGLPLDHIVYAFPDLIYGIEYIREVLEVEPVYGGRHINFGTHNALIGLSQGIYLEIIAPDPDNNLVKPPRWMGVDELKTRGVITRLALKTENISEDLKLIGTIDNRAHLSGKGNRITNTGDLLSWHMSYPFPTPLVDPVPFLVQWKTNFHPADHLNHGFEFSHLELNIPAKFNNISKIFAPQQVTIKNSKSTKIKLYVKRNNKTIVLG